MVDRPCGSMYRGYIRIGLMRDDGRSGYVRGHVLAWLIVYGKMPEHEIDHINGIKSDNRISNLRDVTHAVNGRNQKLHVTNSSGYIGVSKCGAKWRACVYIDGHRKHLGVYECATDADNALRSFRSRNGFHPNHGATNA